MNEQMEYCVMGDYADGTSFWDTFLDRSQADAYYRGLKGDPRVKVLRMVCGSQLEVLFRYKVVKKAA